MMRFAHIASILVLVTLSLGIASCASQRSQSSPYATPEETSRSPLRAETLTQRAADLVESHPDKAEELLRKALMHDLYYGPAHNNLGVVYLSQGKLYEAAHEFEWARKLMPGHPDPRMNLALTLESAGHIDEAIAEYESALEVYPMHLPTVQALARLQVWHARIDERTRDFLKQITLDSTDDRWRRWARQQVLK